MPQRTGNEDVYTLPLLQKLIAPNTAHDIKTLTVLTRIIFGNCFYYLQGLVTGSKTCHLYPASP